MASTVRLKHTIWKEGERIVHFYDGQLTAKNGVVKIPADNPTWIRRAWILGYRLDPKTGDPVELADIVPTEEEESAESEGQVESSNSGGRSSS